MNEIQRSESPVNGVGCSQRVFRSLTVETVTEFMNSICLARVVEENGKFQALTAVLVKIPLLRDENHNILTYLLTPWCRVLLEQLTGLQLVKNSPAFHGTQ